MAANSGTKASRRHSDGRYPQSSETDRITESQRGTY